MLTPYSLDAAAIAVLAGARLLLDRPAAWCQGQAATDAAGGEVPYGSPDAVAFSLGAAVSRSRLTLLDPDQPDVLDALLDDLCLTYLEQVWPHDLDVLNDDPRTDLTQIHGILDHAWQALARFPNDLGHPFQGAHAILTRLAARIEAADAYAGDPEGPQPEAAATFGACLDESVADFQDAHEGPPEHGLHAQLACRWALGRVSDKETGPYAAGSGAFAGLAAADAADAARRAVSFLRDAYDGSRDAGRRT